eukprot:gene15245-4559_t
MSANDDTGSETGSDDNPYIPPPKAKPLSFEERVTAFYLKNAPENLFKVPKIVEKYRPAQREGLFKKLEETYGAAPTNAEAVELLQK